MLRDLVQTAQGSALVALCAALCEGYTPEVSALVLYEMAQSLGALGELWPSFAQWEALTKVAGSVFSGTTLSARINQLTRLSGHPQNQFHCPSHPVDLAQVILAVGEWQRGKLETVHVQGRSACSWVAAWADFVLGLRVQVRSNQGDLIFVSYNDTRLNP